MQNAAMHGLRPSRYGRGVAEVLRAWRSELDDSDLG